MIRRFTLRALAALAALAAGPALACTSTEEVLARFEVVKNAYVAKAPSMTPEQFQLWTSYLQDFGDAMGKQDFPGACAALELAALDIGLDVPPPDAGTATAEKGGGGYEGEVHGVVSGDALAQELAAAAQGGQTTTEPTEPAEPMAAEEWRECPRGRCWLRDRGY